MKTKNLFLGFLLSAIFCFGQVKTGNGNKGVSGTATGDWKPNTQVVPKSNSASNTVGGTMDGNVFTSNWLNNSCYSGIKYRVINYNHINSNGAHWGIMVQNAYGQPATFEYRLIVGGTTWAGEGWDTAYMLGSGKVYTHSNSLVNAMLFNSNSTSFNVEIKNVKLNDNPIDCEGRILPNIKDDRNKNNSNSSANTDVSEHDRIYGTNSTNQNVTQQNQSGRISSVYSPVQQNERINSNDNSSNIEIAQKIYSTTTQLVSDITAYDNRGSDPTTGIDGKIQNMELLKLAEIEPEFNIINTPDDFNKVSMTSQNIPNMLKISTISFQKMLNAFSGIDKIKNQAFEAVKIEAAFLGANTLYVKHLDIGARTMKGSPYTYPGVDLFAIALNDKVLNLNALNQLIEKEIPYKTKLLYVFETYTNTRLNSDYDKKEFVKDIVIHSMTQNSKDQSIIVSATIQGSKQPNIYKLINCTENQFVLMRKTEDKKKIIYENYLVSLR